VANNEVSAMLLERFDWRHCTLADGAAEHEADALVGEVGVLL